MSKDTDQSRGTKHKSVASGINKTPIYQAQIPVQELFYAIYLINTSAKILLAIILLNPLPQKSAKSSLWPVFVWSMK